MSGTHIYANVSDLDLNIYNLSIKWYYYYFYLF
jgi:hypothetical protein